MFTSDETSSEHQHTIKEIVAQLQESLSECVEEKHDNDEDETDDNSSASEAASDQMSDSDTQLSGEDLHLDTNQAAAGTSDCSASFDWGIDGVSSLYSYRYVINHIASIINFVQSRKPEIFGDVI